MGMVAPLFSQEQVRESKIGGFTDITFEMKVLEVLPIGKNGVAHSSKDRTKKREFAARPEYPRRLGGTPDPLRWA